MKTISKIVIVFMLLAFSFQLSATFAKDRRLPGIKIITRTQRGAEEALRYTEKPYHERQARLKKKNQAELDRLAETDLDSFFAKKRNSYETSMANDYLISNYASEQSIDEIRYEYLGNYLKWPESIHKNKMKIIVHHTASDYKELMEGGEDIVIDYLQDVYKYHAITKGRGDVGYHFMIDPYGKVYEGRAGGEGVIAAHTAWNNTPSIGIALMGNFNIQQPTQEQLVTLIRLTTAIAKKYRINPTDKVIYFERDDKPPYLEERPNFSIAGHRDAGNTACPGENLYKILPIIIKQVKSKLTRVRLTSSRTTSTASSTSTQTTSIKTDTTTTSSKTTTSTRSVRAQKIAGVYYSNKSSDDFFLPVSFDKVSACISVDNTMEVKSCSMQGDQLKMTIRKKKSASGIKKFDITVDGQTKRISFRLLWQSDIDKALGVIKNNYVRYGLVTSQVGTSKKISYKKNLTEVKKNLAGDIKVLLYELSTDMDRREISCDGKCKVEVDGKTYTVDRFIAESGNGYLYLTIGENMTWPKTIKVSSSNGGMVKFDNYKRNSYARIPWNIFRGTITFQKESVKDLKSGQYKEQYAVINQLPFKDYLAGIGETSEAENLEKLKLMSLLAKTYALFYIDGKNIHPSIPAGARYDSIDDPRLFQKYVGAGAESTFKKFQAVLKATENKVLLYDGYVPILPYFSCSAGFTFSAKEKRGWIDTPYLPSRYDFVKCPDFNGHGVGLSGKGTQYLAEQGRTYQQILDYYFPGVKIKNL